MTGSLDRYRPLAPVRGMWAAPLAAVDELRVPPDLDAWVADGRRDELVFRAVKHVMDDEPYLVGHFPGFPVLPGVFILECLDQAIRQVLAGRSVRLSAVRSMRFLAPIFPGDTMHLDVSVRASAEPGIFVVRSRCCRDDGLRIAAITAEFAGS